MSQISVLQMIDTLDIGGAERMAVNIANALPQDRYASHVCTTRREGALSGLVENSVGRLSLTRSKRFDAKALAQLQAYLCEHRIGILHAHSTSLFMAVLAARRSPYPRVIWHDHYGGAETTSRSVPLHRLLVRRTVGIIAVNQLLAQWARDCLKVPQEQVWYVPNFVCLTKDDSLLALPGTAETRILCVANLRPQKDHLTLIQAMEIVVEKIPSAHLLLAGAQTDTDQVGKIRREIAMRGLAQQVTLLGSLPTTKALLNSCAVGVLSSESEGMPLALIEYGMAGLPAVSTQVGQCAEVLDNGAAGILVLPKNPQALADALVMLLQSPEKRTVLSERFAQRVRQNYSAEAVIGQICACYDQVLDKKGRT